MAMKHIAELSALGLLALGALSDIGAGLLGTDRKPRTTGAADVLIGCVVLGIVYFAILEVLAH